MVTLEIGGEKKQYPFGTSFEKIAAEYQKQQKDEIVLVLYNNRLRELNKKVEKDGTLTFITAADNTGKKTYRRSATLLMQKAVFNLWGDAHISVRVMYSISQSYYCELIRREEGKQETVPFDENKANELKEEMDRLVAADIPIEKWNMNTDDAIALFKELGMSDKEKLFRYRRSSRVNLYVLDHYKDYFYGFMVPSTGYLRAYDIKPYEDGFVLLFPGKDTNEVAPFEPSGKLFYTLKRSREWGKMLEIDTVGALNDAITAGRTQDIILTQEALFEEQIGNLADEILKSGKKKFVMIAGPSSSGKTTFSHRLSIQLTAKGLKPHPFPLDDYYIDRARCPRDENGELD